MTLSLIIHAFSVLLCDTRTSLRANLRRISRLFDLALTVSLPCLATDGVSQS